VIVTRVCREDQLCEREDCTCGPRADETGQLLGISTLPDIYSLPEVQGRTHQAINIDIDRIKASRRLHRLFLILHTKQPPGKYRKKETQQPVHELCFRLS
jgi:hypothetical protein